MEEFVNTENPRRYFGADLKLRTGDPAMSLTPGAPRTVVGSIRAEF